MVAAVRFAFLLLSIGAVAHGQALTSIAQVPVSVVTLGRPMLRVADTGTAIVFVVRDVNVPDRSVEGAYIALGPRGTDVRAHPARTLSTLADGSARLAGGETTALEVVVLRIGYEAVRFSVTLARQCRQTIEVYISQAIRPFHSEPPPPTPARVVLTTCWPAA